MTPDEVDRLIENGARVTRGILDGLGNVEYDSDTLKHYGVKGMRWGIRNEDDTSGDGSSQKTDWQAANKPKPTPTAKQVAANMAKNEQKSQAKFDGSGKKDEQSFVSKHKKALIYAGVGAAVVGGLYLGNKSYHAKNLASIEQFAGKEIPAQTFASHVQYSKLQTWGKNDFIQPHSFERAEFSLPAGHTFHRISREAETSFGAATYATHSVDDFNRYVAGFRGELGTSKLNHVTFHSTGEIKVPNLPTVLDTLKDVLSERNPGAVFEDHHVLAEYQRLSGGGWKEGSAVGLLESLHKKGYGAIVDEMDAGVIGETPLVVFARDLVGKKASTPLTNDAIDAAESSLIDIVNRKV